MTTIATLSPLSSPEERKLAQYVDDIKQSMGPKFLRIGRALQVIRDHRLFKKDAGINDKSAKPLLLLGKPLTIEQRVLYRIRVEQSAERDGTPNPWAIADRLKEIRDERLYREYAESFEEFCMFVLGFDEAATERYMSCNSPRPATATYTETETPRKTCVYFVECVGHDLVKIGLAKDLKKRLSGLQISTPFDLRTLGIIDGATVMRERQLHRQFKHLRVRGEWFKFTDELREYIAKHATEGK